MASRLLLYLILLVWQLPQFSQAEDPWHFVELGTPPWIAAQPAHARHIHDLTLFQHRVYFSYGNAGTNDGPVEIGCYDPATHAFVSETLLGSEAIGRMKDIGGQLYVPSVDPAHFYNQTDFAVRSSAGVWKHHRQIGMLHAYDISALSDTDKLILTGSSRDIRDGSGANTLVWTSADSGVTWQPLLRNPGDPSASGRSRYAIPYGGRVHFSGKFYDGVDCHPFPGALAIAIDAYMTFQDDVLYTPGTPGESGTSSSIMLILFDGEESRPLTEVLDFFVVGDRVWTLEPGPALRVTENLTDWQPVETQGLPANAVRLAVEEDRIYVTTGEGRLWMGMTTIPDEDLPEPAIHRTGGDAGTSLAMLADFTVMGVPASGAEPWNHGHVEIADADMKATFILQAPDPSSLAYFGAQVAGADDWIAVSEAKRRDAKVHLYQQDEADSSWHWRQTLEHHQDRQASTERRPVHSLAMAGTFLVIGWEGAIEHTEDPAFSVYERQGDAWQAIMEEPLALFNEDLDSEAYVRCSVALTEQLLAVGLSGDPSDNKGQGLVALYGRQAETESWQRLQFIPELEPETSFGASLAINDAWLAIGAPRGRGKVYLYAIENDQMAQQSPLISPADDEARFGHALAIDGDRLLVGAPESNWLDNTSGRAFLYKLAPDAGALLAEFNPGESGTRGFGNVVAMAHGQIALGSTSGNVQMLDMPTEDVSEIRVGLSNHDLHLQWQAVAGRTYLIEESQPLRPPSWQIYKTVTAQSDTHFEMIPIRDAQRRFFRVGAGP